MTPADEPTKPRRGLSWLDLCDMAPALSVLTVVLLLVLVGLVMVA